ncbi:coiled-coil domain-containing protein 57 [Genypterus blacodes]|uniref:coiled-coil domain-containing protein 57 n=1 Tax=Genypterus blacodes TaxID=154954 RepID=UPI003F758DE7
MIYPSVGVMLSDDEGKPVDLQAELTIKEREWKELQYLRVHQLESSLKKAQNELSALRQRFQHLREDYEFNLAVLDERDRELERYDAVTARALTEESNRQEQLSQLRRQVARLEKLRASEATERMEELRISQDQAAHQKLLLEEVQGSLIDEIQRQRQENECLERELTLQKQDMTADFNNELKGKEHVFNLKMDEMRAVVLSHDLKTRLMCKEVEVLRQVQLQIEEALKQSHQLSQQLQAQLQHKECESKNLTTVKENRIKELEADLKRIEANWKKSDDEHIKKHKDLDQALRESGDQKQAQRHVHTEQLQKAKDHIAKLQKDMEVQAAHASCAHKEEQDKLNTKDKMIQRLRKDGETLQAALDQSIGQASREMVTKDAEMLALQRREAKLRAELERGSEEIERYKQKLSAGLEREKALEQKQVQVQLDWQTRCEDTKAERYLASEQLIQTLTQSRDQAKAELGERERELQDLTTLLHSTKMERDQALQGLAPNVDDLALKEMSRLQQQNNTLLAVVAQMRKDMESLGRLLPQSQSKSSFLQPFDLPNSHTASTPTTTEPPARPSGNSYKPSPAGTCNPEYTQAVEQEVLLLKARCRQLEDTTGPTADKPTELNNTASEKTNLHKHKEAIEKEDSTSALNRHKLRGTHLQSDLPKVTQKSETMRQLYEENLHLLQQQLTLGLKSRGTFAVQCDQSNAPLLRTKLKQADRSIAHLRIEKQQLIEMGNSLRAQIITTRIQGPQFSREPPRESENSVRDSPKEKPGDQQSKLSALEQLQYQLTTQELQYVLRQAAPQITKEHLSSTNSKGPDKDGAAIRWSQGRKTTARPDSSRSKENTLLQTQSESVPHLDKQPQPYSNPPAHLLSSEESLGSLKEVWEMLDCAGNSPSILSEGELNRGDMRGPDDPGVRLNVHGNRAPVHLKPQTQQDRKNPSRTSINMTKTKICKIRNYNIKE